MPKRQTKRRARRNTAPVTGLTSSIARYLSSSTDTRIMPLPPKAMTHEVLLTAVVQMNFGAGVGFNGLLIPEHPGRAPSQFGGMTISANTEWAYYAALFDEFKVTAIICEYQPEPLVLTVDSLTLAGLCDYDSEVTAGSLTSIILAARYTTGRILAANKEHQLIYKPPRQRAFPEWTSTANTSSPLGSIYYLLNSTSVVKIYVGVLVVKYVVKFRNSNG